MGALDRLPAVLVEYLFLRRGGRDLGLIVEALGELLVARPLLDH